MTEIEEAARELFALPLSEFTAARNTRAKKLPALKALPKASASAWLVNALARQNPDAIDDIDELGEKLRRAQSARDRTAMTEASRERKAVLKRVLATAASVAQKAGHASTAAVLTEVEQTLTAAMTDEDAAAAVRSGLLVRALSTNGLDPVDLDGALALDGSTPPPRPPRATKVDRDTAAENRAAAARAELERAIAARDAASEELAAATNGVGAAEKRREALEAEREDLQAQLDEVDGDISVVERELRELKSSALGAERKLARAAVAVERAEREAR